MHSGNTCRIGIITTFWGHNYGAILQSYALQCILKQLGYPNAEQISQGRKRASRLLSLALHPSRLIKRLSRPNLAGRYDHFNAFVNTSIKTSGRKYYTLDDLRATNEAYDVFICGSDQIWAPNQFDERYYLSFVDDKRKTLAYAPSIGLPVIPEHLKPRMAQLIRDIAHLSVREEQGAEIIYDLTGLRVPVVLDPTLLISKERWRDMAATPTIQEPYVLCYFLGANPKHRELAERYKSKSGCKLVSLPLLPCDYSWGDVPMHSAGPREFVGLVGGASAVITDSYHGMLFAVNMNRPFYALYRFKATDALCQNSRVINSLNVFGLSDRLVDDEAPEIANVSDIDFDSVNSVLMTKRRESIDFLKSSLQDILHTNPMSMGFERASLC